MSIDDTLNQLSDAMAQLRERRNEEIIQHREDVGTPFGAELYALNQEWGKTRRAHEAKLATQKAMYLKQAEEIRAKIREYRLAHPSAPKRNVSGRPKTEFTDEIKILAYQATRERGAKTHVRLLLGVSDTERLNQVIEEGRLLYEAQTATITEGPAPTLAADDDNEGGW